MRLFGRRAGSTALALATTAVGVICLTSAAAPAQGSIGQDGLLRIAHLSPSTGAVDMYAEGPGLPLTRVASSVSYRGLTSYLPEAPGIYTLQARPAGAPASTPPALSASVAVAPGSAQTAAFVDVGPGSTPQAEVLTDSTITPPPGQALVRVSPRPPGWARSTWPPGAADRSPATSSTAPRRATPPVDARTWTMDVTHQHRADRTDDPARAAARR